MNNITLDPHQEEGVEFILKHKKAALFMGVGTGKTYTALEIYKRANPKNCLIITTARLIHEKQWDEEMIEYLGSIPNNITLLSHQKFTRNYDKYKLKKYQMIIIDEAHKIKSKAKKRGGTKISRLVKKLSERAEYVIPMTGTPVGKEFIDVFNIFRNCDIKMWHGWEEYEFIEAYYYFVKRSFGSSFKITVPIELKPHLESTLWKLIRQKAYVVKTNDVLDLKKQKIKLLYVDGLDQTDIYKNLERKILKYDGFEDTLITLRRVMFKRQAANGFIYDETYDRNPIVFNKSKIEMFESKIQYFIDKLGKIVVTYWFKQDKQNIINTLDKLSIKHTTKRSEFRKDADVFLLHFSDSEGLNLQKISRAMLHYSYESSYTMFSQIAGRIYRRGQDEKCYYIIMISTGTIEEKMWNNIKNRKEKDDFVKNELEE